MDSEFTFPLALCKAQWSISLHGLAMLETCAAQCLALGAQVLEDSSAQTRRNADAVAGTGDWPALPSAIAQAEQPLPAHTLKHAADASPSRNEVVQGALHTLAAALNAHPVRRHRQGKARPARGTS